MNNELDTSTGYVPNQWYPSVLELVNQLAGGGADRLTTSLGQMHRDIGGSGAVLTPTQRPYNQVGFEVYYYNRYGGSVPDRTPPHVTNVRLTPNANQVQASVAVTDVKGLNDAAALGIWRVVVAYTVNTPAGTGQWDSVELTYEASTRRWIGAVPFDGTGQLLLLVQAVDRSGNVVADDNRGWYYTLYRAYLPLLLRNR